MMHVKEHGHLSERTGCKGNTIYLFTDLGSLRQRFSGIFNKSRQADLHTKQEVQDVANNQSLSTPEVGKVWPADVFEPACLPNVKGTCFIFV